MPLLIGLNQQQLYSKFSSLSLSGLLFTFLSLLFFSYGVNACAYITLYTSGAIGLLVLARSWHQKILYFPHQFWIPIVFFLYIAITPGLFFKDLRIAGLVAAAFFAGCAGAYCNLPKLQRSFPLLNLGLIISFVTYTSYCLITHKQLFVEWRRLQFSQPNILGCILSFAIILTISFHDKITHSLQKIYLLSTIPLTIVLILTNARTSILAMFLSFFFMVPIKYGIKKTFFLLASAIILLALITIVSPDRYKKRTISAILNPTQDQTLKTRMPIWHTAFKGFTEKPLLGQGVRYFKQFDQNYKKNEFENLLRRFPQIEKKASHPHNIFLASLFGWGLIGSLLFFLTVGIALFHAITFKDYFTIWIIAYTAISGLFESYLNNKIGAITLFFPLGITYASIISTYKKNSDQLKSPSGSIAN